MVRAIALGVLVILLIPIFIVVDSYRIVLDVRPLARETPDRTAVMKERLANPRIPRPFRNRHVRLNSISPHLIHSVIVHEDATFYQHNGFDAFEIRAALKRSLAERQLGRGASTITTQLARILYLGTSRSLLRKLREIPLTVRLEGALSKQRILELYLNLAEWGPGVFGAESASLHHFGTSASNLTPAQAALLSAALPSPRRSTPGRPSAYLRRRARIILTRMEARGWLPSYEAEAYRQELGGGPPVAGAEIESELESELELESEMESEGEIESQSEIENDIGAEPEIESEAEKDSAGTAEAEADSVPAEPSDPPAPSPEPPSQSPP